MNPAIPPGGDDVLLQQHLYGIGYRLEDALRPGTIGALADLEPPHPPPLDVDKGHHHQQDEGEEDSDGDQPGNKICCPFGQVVKQPLLKLLQNRHHRSTSPMQTSMLPKMITASASFHPMTRSRSTVRLMSDGARTLKR